MSYKHKLFTFFVALATAFSFLAIATPTSANAATEDVAIGEGYSAYIPAKEHAESHTSTNPERTASALYEEENPPLLGRTYGHSDLIEITNADFFDTPMTVSYPEGFRAKVEVNHPEYVEDIQWVLSDGHDLLDIPGLNQGGYEFYMPSTNPYDKNFYLCAVVTDANGDRLITEDLAVTVDGSVKIPVLYVAEYALTQGESLNLADKNYGTGTIAFDENGTDVTFIDAQMNVDESAKYMDKQISMGTDIFFYYGVYNPEDYTSDLPTNFNFNFKGDTSIINNLYNERTYSSLGVELNFYFYCTDNYANRPTVTLSSDDTLTLHGGTRGINTDGNLVLDLDFNYTPFNDQAYTTAIYSTGLTVAPGHTLNVASNHGLIESSGDVIFGDGTTLIAKSTPTQAHNEYLGVAAIAAAGDLKMSSTTFDFTGEVVADKFIENNLTRFPTLIASGDMEIKDSDASIDIEYTGESPRGDFAYSLTGLYVNNRDHALTIDNSNVSISLNSPNVINVAGVSSLGAANIINSIMDIDIAGRGQVLGIGSQDLLTIEDSSVNSNVVAETHPDVTDEFAGIVGRPITVNLSDATHKIHSKINQGAAFVSANKTTLPANSSHPVYDAGYTPSLTELNGTEILLPEDGVLSSYTYTSYTGNEFRLAETPYSLSDTSTPALDVIIAISPESNDVPGSDGTSDSDTPIPVPLVPNTGAFTRVKE